MSAGGVEPSAYWLIAHEALSRLAQQQAAGDAEEGRWLLAAQRAAAHVHLGFGSFFEYVERLFGYRPRSVREKLRVAQALESLPALARALEEGKLNWSAVRELTRIVVAETESVWLELAQGKSLRELEELVAGKQPGDSPSAAPDPSAQRHVLRFEVSAEAFALLREAMAELRRRSNSALNDDAALLEMARCVLVGPHDEGRSSYQIALSVCPQCSSAHLSGNGQLVPVGWEVVDKAQCDAQHLTPLTPLDRPLHMPVETPTTTTPHSIATTPLPTSTPLPIASTPLPIASTPLPIASTPLPVTMLRSAHVGQRAKQDVPPATRRAVIQRDHHRCRVPGCKNAIFLDIHHLQPRADGGSHEAANLITICGAHHDAIHHGRLHTEGNAASLRVLHADGRVYGQPQLAHVVDVQTKVFAGLRGLGFREGEVRTVMAELRQREDLHQANAEQWLREALRRLHPQRTHAHR